MIEIIPAIDLMDGKCVRLTQGDFAQKQVYAEDPVETAKSFESAGVRRLHIVDLDGARSGKPANTSVLERIARATKLTIDFGGGIKTDEDVRTVLDAGAAIVNIGSVAVKEPERFFGWLSEFGSGRILLGADSMDRKVAINGWQTKTEIELIPFLQNYVTRGGGSAFVTDIARDGVMAGPATELYAEILAIMPDLRLIASGGVSSMDDIYELDRVGCSGVIVGKAIYEGRVTLGQISEFICSQNA